MKKKTKLEEERGYDEIVKNCVSNKRTGMIGHKEKGISLFRKNEFEVSERFWHLARPCSGIRFTSGSQTGDACTILLQEIHFGWDYFNHRPLSSFLRPILVIHLRNDIHTAPTQLGQRRGIGWERMSEIFTIRLIPCLGSGSFLF